jgi:AcrR family transcriptional regulator
LAALSAKIMSPRTKQQFADLRKDRRQAILDAALQVFANHGYHSASVSMIAKEAGVSKGLMYNYFESKEAVLLTLVNDLFDRVVALIGLQPGEVLTRERFIELIDVSIDIAVKEPQRWKLYMSLGFQPEVTPILMETMMPKVAPFMASLAQYFHSKGHEDPMTIMRYYSAVLDGVQMHALLDPHNFPVEKVKQMVIAQFA